MGHDYGRALYYGLTPKYYPRGDNYVSQLQGSTVSLYNPHCYGCVHHVHGVRIHADYRSPVLTSWGKE